MGQYFDLTLEGAAAADDVTLAAIKAINNIPDRVVYEDRDIVAAARAAYDKIATIAQQALVTNYDKLLQAEQRVLALTPEEAPVLVEDEKTAPWGTIICIVTVAVILVGGAVAFVLLRKRKGNAAATEQTKAQELCCRLCALLKGLMKPAMEESPETEKQTEDELPADAEKKEEVSSEE